MKKQFIAKALILGLTSLALTSCGDDTKSTPAPVLEGNFLVAANVNSTNTYLLTAQDLDDENASITTIGSGLEYSGIFSNYMQDGYKGFVAINYGRGDAHLGQRFTLNAAGQPIRLGAQFEIQNGFITAGIVGDVAYSLMSGNRSSDPTLATINRIPMSSGNPTYSFFKVNEFKGYEGKNTALIGVTDAGNGSFFTGLEFPARDVDNVVVAKINTSTLTTENVYSDNRLSVSGGFYRSGRYSQIGTADNGDVYVFSGNNYGTKRAGALLIKKGADGFDQNYYWDIETASGGYRFRRLWHVSEDKFLLEFYNETIEANVSSPSMGPATQFAIVDMSDKKLTWISGIPSKGHIPDLTGMGWPYVFDGKLYMGISTALEDPRFYVVDPATAVAKKGLSVKGATVIESVTFVEKN